MGGYPVSLSSIGAIQQVCEAFSLSNVAKTPKITFLRRCLAQNLLFFHSKWSLLIFGHILQSNGRLPCKFELNRSITANLRGVFLKRCRKTPKNPFCRSFLTQNLNFVYLKLSFLLIGHLFQFHRRLPCKFELNRGNTANL